MYIKAGNLGGLIRGCCLAGIVLIGSSLAFVLASGVLIIEGRPATADRMVFAELVG